ncbi:uncharacterized protein A4U43_C07F29520 [Asparagus officinalis]|uniref:Uncharacterized protein n=1 Tax=Asparagus officinalis TaxID=4686 RepID=A0A5P1EFY7_ASPOF|nr:uncharacterized protein A4U43_C07F29520 [Asparagus officinalis]
MLLIGSTEARPQYDKESLKENRFIPKCQLDKRSIFKSSATQEMEVETWKRNNAYEQAQLACLNVEEMRTRLKEEEAKQEKLRWLLCRLLLQILLLQLWVLLRLCLQVWLRVLVLLFAFKFGSDSWFCLLTSTFALTHGFAP